MHSSQSYYEILEQTLQSVTVQLLKNNFELVIFTVDKFAKLYPHNSPLLDS